MNGELVTELVIPDGVTKIGDYAFSGCKNLASITIPACVANIGNSAFNGCTGLTAVYISDLSAWYNVSFGDNSANPLHCAKNLYLNGELVTELVIPDGVTKIGDYSFSGCSGLASITIPNSVTNIGKGAFNGCTGLKKVEINCASVEKWFSGLSSIQEIVLGNDVRKIGSYAFQNCTGLTSVIIPNSVSSIGNGAFQNCTGLKKVEINCASVENWFSGLPSIQEIVLGNEVREIGSYAFQNCTGLTSVIIPNSVSSIGNGAFQNCTGLKKVEINCASVENWFSGLPSIQEIVLGNEVREIGSYAFYDCTGLTNIIIPNSVTSIGYCAFIGCSNLRKVMNFSEFIFRKGDSYHGNVAFYADEVINLPNGCIDGDWGWCEINGVNTLGRYLGNASELTLPVDYKGESYVIGEGAFKDCSTIKSVAIPNGVTSIKKEAFCDCTGLTNVTIGNSVTEINQYAFRYCTGLRSVTLGANVASIGYGAFERCRNHTVINYSKLTLIKGEWENGAVAQFADEVINLPNGCIDGDFAWCKINGVNTLARYFGNASELTLPDDYKGESYVIGEGAFKACLTIKSVAIPNGVTSIEEDAFCFCTGLTNVTIGNSVTSIGDYAFYGCTNLKTIINYSKLTLEKGKWKNGNVAQYAEEIINKQSE